MTVNPLLAQFTDEPAFVSPGHLNKFQACLEQAVADPRFAELQSMSSADMDFWNEDDGWARPYNVVDGVLQVPVRGVLLNNFPYQFYGYATGYDFIVRSVRRGMNDPEVNGIALVIDSPGGYVAGNQDAVDDLYAMRGTKPIKAYSSDAAYSAAYNIASVADELVVSTTGGVGSIGVMTMHVDYSENLSKNGIKITYIYAGKHKVEGNSSEPLADDVKNRIQARIDALYEVFVSSVARNRGLEAQAVRDTEAGVFYGADALSNGLADKVGRIDAALSAFADQLKGERAMSDQKDNDKAAADHAAAIQEASIKAAAEARTAERARIGAITGSEEAKGRETLAAHLANHTDMTAEAAIEVLKASPVAVAAAPVEAKTPFTEGANTNNPNVGDGGANEDEKQKESVATGVIARLRQINPALVKES